MLELLRPSSLSWRLGLAATAGFLRLHTLVFPILLVLALFFTRAALLILRALALLVTLAALFIFLPLLHALALFALLALLLIGIAVLLFLHALVAVLAEALLLPVVSSRIVTPARVVSAGVRVAVIASVVIIEAIVLFSAGIMPVVVPPIVPAIISMIISAIIALVVASVVAAVVLLFAFAAVTHFPQSGFFPGFPGHAFPNKAVAFCRNSHALKVKASVTFMHIHYPSPVIGGIVIHRGRGTVRTAAVGSTNGITA